MKILSWISISFYKASGKFNEVFMRAIEASQNLYQGYRKLSEVFKSLAIFNV